MNISRARSSCSAAARLPRCACASSCSRMSTGSCSTNRRTILTLMRRKSCSVRSKSSRAPSCLFPMSLNFMRAGSTRFGTLRTGQQKSSKKMYLVDGVSLRTPQVRTITFIICNCFIYCIGLD